MTYVFEPQVPMALSTWTVGSIRNARDLHGRGDFERSAALADASLVDGRIMAALSRRLGPALGIPIDVSPPARWNGKGLGEVIRSETQALFAEGSTSCSPGLRVACYASQAMMGFAIAQNIWRPRADGSRIDLEIRPWPAQLSRWNDALRRYQVQTMDDGLVDVEPGDGKWLLVEPWGPRSYKYGAIRALALLWADRAYAMRDRSNHSAAHGSISIIGTLPAGVAPDSPSGRSFTASLRMLQQARSGMVKPNGSAVDPFEPKTLAFQIFNQIVSSVNADYELLLCGIGSDGVYKSIPQLDGVRYDLVQLDVQCLSTALLEQSVKPWVAYNWGAGPEFVPGVRSLVPDPREQSRLRALAEQHTSFASAIQQYRTAGFEISEPLVVRLAEMFGLDPDFAALLEVAETPEPAPAVPAPAPAPPKQDPEEKAEEGAEDDA